MASLRNWSGSMREAMGISDTKVREIVENAAQCIRETEPLANDERALIFEARLRAANEEQPSEAITERLKQLGAERTQIVMNFLQRLKTSLGAERFKRIDDYIRAHANTGPFFPLAPGPKPKRAPDTNEPTK